MSATPPPTAAPAAPEPTAAPEPRTRTLEASPFKKKLDAMTPAERIAQVKALRNQIEKIEKDNGSFSEVLRDMSKREVHETIDNVKKTFAGMAKGDLAAAAFATKMAKLTPEDQHKALKHMESLNAENLTTHKLVQVAMLEITNMKIMLGQMALQMEAMSTVMITMGLRQEDFITALQQVSSKGAPQETAAAPQTPPESVAP